LLKSLAFNCIFGKRDIVFNYDPHKDPFDVMVPHLNHI
jgi:hypothetical protein